MSFYPQTSVLHVSALTSSIIKLIQCKIRVSNNILPAGQQQKVYPPLGFFQLSSTFLLRDASEMQRDAGSTRWTASLLSCRDAHSAKLREIAQETCALGRQGPPSQTQILRRKE